SATTDGAAQVAPRLARIDVQISNLPPRFELNQICRPSYDRCGVVSCAALLTATRSTAGCHGAVVVVRVADHRSSPPIPPERCDLNPISSSSVLMHAVPSNTVESVGGLGSGIGVENAPDPNESGVASSPASSPRSTDATSPDAASSPRVGSPNPSLPQ